MGFNKTHKHDINKICLIKNKKESELVIQNSLPHERMRKKKKKRHSSVLDEQNCIIKKVYKHKTRKVHKARCVMWEKNNLDGINSSNIAEENVNDKNNTTKFDETPFTELITGSSKLSAVYKINKSPGYDVNEKYIDKESSTQNEYNNTSRKKCLSESNINSTDTENENNMIKSIEQINSSTTTAEYATIRESLNKEKISGNEINSMENPPRTTDFSTFNCDNIQEHVQSMEVVSISDTDSNQSYESCQNKIGDKSKSKTLINEKEDLFPKMNEPMSTTAEHSRLNQTNSKPRESCNKNLQESRKELISKNGIYLRKTLELVNSTTMNHENIQENISTIDVDYEPERYSNKRFKASLNENREKEKPKTSNIRCGSPSFVINISKSKTTPDHYSIRNKSNFCHELLFMKGLELIKSSLGITDASTSYSHIITIDIDSNTVLSATHESAEYKKDEKTKPGTPTNVYDSFPFSFKHPNKKQKVCQKEECLCDKNIQQINKLIQNTPDNQTQSKILHTLIYKSPKQTSALPNVRENICNSQKPTGDTNETSCSCQNGQTNMPYQVPYRIHSSSQLFFNPEDPGISKPQPAVSNRDSQNDLIMSQYTNKQKYFQSSNLPVSTQFPMGSRQNYNDYPQVSRNITSNNVFMYPDFRHELRGQTSKTISGGYLDKRLRYNIQRTNVTRESTEKTQSPRHQTIQELITATNNQSQHGLDNSNQHFHKSESESKIQNYGQISSFRSIQKLTANINISPQPNIEIMKQNLCDIKSGLQIQKPGCIQNVGQTLRSETQSLETGVELPKKSIFSITQPTTIWHPTGLNNPKAIPILLIPIPTPVESQGLQK